jgi:hypothetical protein
VIGGQRRVNGNGTVRGRCEMQSEGVAMLVVWRIAGRGKCFEVSLELLLVHGIGHLERGSALDGFG